MEKLVLTCSSCCCYTVAPHGHSNTLCSRTDSHRDHIYIMSPRSFSAKDNSKHCSVRNISQSLLDIKKRVKHEHILSYDWCRQEDWLPMIKCEKTANIPEPSL